jgi:hypothetical protein
MLNGQVQVAPFKEHPIIDYAVAEPGDYDIIAFGPDHPSSFITSGKFSLQQYCVCLLHKLFLLDKSDIKPFIQYQCEQLTEPFIWLNKFEKLIDLNRDLFTSKDREIKIEKALMLIELLRQEIQNNKFSQASRFNFQNVKQKIKNYSSTEEKLLFLAEAKTEYLQNKAVQVPSGEVPFDEKVQLEIDLLKTQRKLSKKITPLSVGEGAGLRPKSPLSPLKKSPAVKDKFQINTNLNVFVDIFFQLMHEKKVGSKPYIDATPNELAEMIATWFKDKEGKEISIETIKTILKPSRFEKRPKGSAKFEIE